MTTLTFIYEKHFLDLFSKVGQKTEVTLCFENDFPQARKVIIDQLDGEIQLIDEISSKKLELIIVEGVITPEKTIKKENLGKDSRKVLSMDLKGKKLNFFGLTPKKEFKFDIDVYRTIEGKEIYLQYVKVE